MERPVKKQYQTKRPFDWFALFIYVFIILMVSVVFATLKYG